MNLFWMRRSVLCIALWMLFLLLPLPLHAEKTRLIVLSDIGGSDPDDQQSWVHLLTLLDGVDLEGFIYQYAWVPFNVGNEEKVCLEIVEAYEQVLPNLQQHSAHYPEADALRQIIKHGQSQAAMAGVGEGKDSPGSEWIIKVVDSDDPRPVWITTWAGINTLAQALWKVRQTRTEEALQRFVKKIRVYDILGQDDAGAWLVTNFPDLLYIRNTAVYGWAPQDEWIRQNVQAMGPLGRVYPTRRWATEGDSPAFLYLVDNALNFPEYPHWGGWGGRFDREKKVSIPAMDWVRKAGLDEGQYHPYLMLGSSPEGVGAINMWKEDIYNDFAARMQWSVHSDYQAVNHHPCVAIGKDFSKDVVCKKVRAGATVELNAGRSFDPDDDALSYQWIFYREASDYQGNLSIEDAGSKCKVLIPKTIALPSDIHIVLRVTDMGKPALASYRRVLLQVR